MGNGKQANLPTRSFHSHPAKHGLWIDFNRVQLDGRSKLAKWVKTLRSSLTRDLGGNLSTQQAILVDRAVHKTVKCYLFETQVLDGNGPGSRDHYLACCNSLRLDLMALGLEKRIKDLPDLESYLRSKAELKGEK